MVCGWGAGVRRGVFAGGGGGGGGRARDPGRRAPLLRFPPPPRSPPGRLVRSGPGRGPGSVVWDPRRRPRRAGRSEEHTSELQSLTNLVCRLLLEKKKTETGHRCVIDIYAQNKQVG